MLQHGFLCISELSLMFHRIVSRGVYMQMKTIFFHIFKNEISENKDIAYSLRLLESGLVKSLTEKIHEHFDLLKL